MTIETADEANNTALAHSADRTSSSVPPGSRDRGRAVVLAVGAALWAAGNLMHPLEHAESSEQAATWAAAHLTFAVGAVLMAVGLPALIRAIRRPGDERAGKMLTLAHGLLFAGLAVVIPIGAYHEVFVSTHLDHHAATEIADASAAVLAPLSLALLLGFVLLAVYALIRPAAVFGRWSGVLIILGTLSMTVAAMLPGVLPGAEGWWIIPGTVAQGVAIGLAGVRIAR
ncbi:MULTISPECIES: hypothetical protein [Nocardia]|jgi:hypothetical protein|uniref:hypothetical protein n=1 Tax=Nocardia TaxID=1817 RepID=UPI0029317DE7|nr:hypothetical protein [Nocardia canadensis]